MKAGTCASCGTKYFTAATVDTGLCVACSRSACSCCNAPMLARSEHALHPDLCPSCERPYREGKKRRRQTKQGGKIVLFRGIKGGRQ